MSQQAKQPIAVNTATTRDGSTTLNTVVTRPVPRTGKQTREEAESDAAMIPAQAILLGQVTGEPLGAAPQNNEACPVSEPGVADPCGVAGAADAHPAAGGALWALAALPLLGAGGGGGGGNAPITVTSITPNPPAGKPSSTVIDGKSVVSHPINDNPAGFLFDFNSNKDATGAKYSIVEVKDGGGNIVQHNPLVSPEVAKAVAGSGPLGDSPYATGYNDPAKDPWFYLDENTGSVYLTNAGAAAHCIGSSFTLTIKAEALNDSDNSDTTTLTFTVAPPAGNDLATWTADQIGERYGDAPSEVQTPSDFDVVFIGNATGSISRLNFIGLYDGKQGDSIHNELAMYVGSNNYEIVDQYGSNHFEYLTFINEVIYYQYDLKHGNITFKVTESDLAAYYTLPDADGSIGGSECNNILIGSFTDTGGSTIDSDNGNDLIFSTWMDTPPHPTPNIPVDKFNGGSGNDLLAGGWGDDQLYGGSGNDVLIGGYGINNLNGGDGADIFVFNVQETSAKADTIQDFNAGEGDKILLDKSIFTHPEKVEFISGILSYDSIHLANIQGTGVTRDAVMNAVIYA